MFAVPPEALLPWKRAFVGFVLITAPDTVISGLPFRVWMQRVYPTDNCGHP